MWLSTVVIVAYIAITEILFKEQRHEIEALQEFHYICAWCNKVKHNGEYIPVEVYLKLKTHMESSHGICEDCHNNELHKLSLFGNVL